MFDHNRKNHFNNEDMRKYKYGNDFHYYQEDAYHYDRINYSYQDYNSYSNASANSYDYGCRPTFNDTNFFENSYEDQPYSTHSSFISQNTSPYPRSSDFYSNPYCDQVDNTLLEFLRETHEEIRISCKRMEEMKLEIENLKSERDMDVLKYNSKFHAKGGKFSNVPLENP